MNIRKPKELKDHFHTFLVKSVRKIINNKFEYELKDIMKSFYIFEYLFQMIKDYRKYKTFKHINFNKQLYQFNPKLLIQKKQLSIEKIYYYSLQLMYDILLTKPGINNFLLFINYKDKFKVNHILWLFSIIVKSKIIKNCKKILDNDYYIDNFDKNKIENYLEENSIYIYLDDFFFSQI